MATHAKGRDCRVCLGPHRKSDHERALDLHRWFKAELLRKIEAPMIAKKPTVARPGFGRTPLVIDEEAVIVAPEPEDLDL